MSVGAGLHCYINYNIDCFINFRANLFTICSERSSAGGGRSGAQLRNPWNVLQYMRIPSTARRRITASQ